MKNIFWNVDGRGPGVEEANLLKSRTILKELASGERCTDELEHMTIDRRATREFIADHATLLAFLAKSAGMPTVRILSELLYTYAFCDDANEPENTPARSGLAALGLSSLASQNRNDGSASAKSQT